MNFQMKKHKINSKSKSMFYTAIVKLSMFNYVTN